MDSTYSLEQNCQVQFVATTINFVEKLLILLKQFYFNNGLLKRCKPYEIFKGFLRISK